MENIQFLSSNKADKKFYNAFEVIVPEDELDVILETQMLGATAALSVLKDSIKDIDEVDPDTSDNNKMLSMLERTTG